MQQENQPQHIPTEPFTTDISLETARESVEAMQLQGNTRSPEFFMRNFQRRTLQIIEKGKQWNDGITVEEMSRQFYRITQEARAGGSEEAQQITSALDWAFIIYAVPYNDQLIDDLLIHAYNTMQREAGGVPGVELTGNASNLFAWALQQVNIPHEPSAGWMCVLFAPLERHMREYAAATGRASDFLYGSMRDQESRANTTSLMEAWQQSQDTSSNQE